MTNAGVLLWTELEVPTDIVLIVGLDWCIIHDYQIQRRQMSIES